MECTNARSKAHTAVAGTDQLRTDKFHFCAFRSRVLPAMLTIPYLISSLRRVPDPLSFQSSARVVISRPEVPERQSVQKCIEVHGVVVHHTASCKHGFAQQHIDVHYWSVHITLMLSGPSFHDHVLHVPSSPCRCVKFLLHESIVSCRPVSA